MSMALAHQTTDPRGVTTTHRAEVRQDSTGTTSTATLSETLPPAFTVGYIRGDTKSPETCPPLWTSSTIRSPFAAWGCCNTQAECLAFWGTCIDYKHDGISGDLGASAPTPGSTLSCSSGNPSCVQFILSTATGDSSPLTSYGCGSVALDVPVLARATEPQNGDAPFSSRMSKPSDIVTTASITRVSAASRQPSATSTSSHHSTLNNGAIAGIVIAAAVCIGLAIGGWIIWIKPKRITKKKIPEKATDVAPEADTSAAPLDEESRSAGRETSGTSGILLAKLSPHRDEFKIAIVCALVVESDSVLEAMDETWDDDNTADRDGNRYTHGMISGHKVVLVFSPGSGQTTTAISVQQVRNVYPNIKLALVVGVCGGVPILQQGEEIFLGDLIISTSTVTVDFGRQHDLDFERYRTVRNPSDKLKSFLNKTQGSQSLRKVRRDLAENLRHIQERRLEHERSPRTQQKSENLVDELFESTYIHKHRSNQAEGSSCECLTSRESICSVARDLDCKELGCDKSSLVPRDNRTDRYNELGHFQPRIHFGRVGSGNVLMRSGQLRDKIARREKLIAFEMEGAAVYQVYDNTIIIKAACDYADSHKSKAWQPYAADIAAAGMKAILAAY